jgi:hypothetical protein
MKQYTPHSMDSCRFGQENLTRKELVAAVEQQEYTNGWSVVFAIGRHNIAKAHES